MLFCFLSLRLWGLFERADVLGGWHVDFLAVQQLFDREDLKTRVLRSRYGFSLEEACLGGFFAHGGGGGFEGDEDADGRFFAFDDAENVADLGGGDSLEVDNDWFLSPNAERRLADVRIRRETVRLPAIVAPP